MREKHDLLNVVRHASLTSSGSSRPIARSNAFLVSALIDLDVTRPDAVAAMEAAYAADNVDESVCGDWQDVQVELGLLSGRLTPKPPPLFERLAARARVETADFFPPSPQIDRTKKEKAKKAKARVSISHRVVRRVGRTRYETRHYSKRTGRQEIL